MANHLLNEKSPYLLQHAENPVDWYPWSEEAFKKADAEDKPVFLSIGYSTCHWCHVMAHESFEDEEIARILNENFVSIKVDREERPEIDMVYMSVCQTLTGQGGWPLTIIMTKDKKPFFAGTYFPKKSTYQMTGLRELLTGITELWKGSRYRLLEMSQQILSLQKEKTVAESGGILSWELIQQGFLELQTVFDKTWGGFGRAPKFPTPHNLLFLFLLYEVKQEKKALAMAEKTLLSMARGGIHDQIGGGFSRYSTDDMWLVPHFEKMLYDNALLLLAYLEGYRLTSRNYYKVTAEKIITYVDRELTDKEGGFYCGQDADSEGVEGNYYVFSEKEIGLVLKPEEKEDFCSWFGFTENGNFEGRHIPNLIHNQNYEVCDSHMDLLCKKVYDYRLKRTRLHKDDKILTSWNSMMILAYARAGFVLENPDYTEKAKAAQAFTERNLADKNDRLLVRYRDGESAFWGNLDDYAYYSLALLTLYEVTLDIKYLEMAIHRAGQMVDLFWDHEYKGFYFYGTDAPLLIKRPKEIYDGATPSGNSVAAHVLLKLTSLTADPKWLELTNQHLNYLAACVKETPSAHTFSLMALIKALGEEKQLICVSADNEAPDELLAYRKKKGNQFLTILFKCPDNEKRLSQTSIFTKVYEIPEKGVCYYECKNHTCSLPSSTLF